MIGVLEQIILGLAFWFATATILMPLMGVLWYFVRVMLGETETWKRI